MPSFLERLAERPVLVADGATGTNYQAMGIAPGVAPEEWIFDAPGQVQELHRRFVAAGSELVLTCTFGATSTRQPYGPLTRDTAVAAYAEQAGALAAAGVDLLVLETFFSVDEALWAAEGVQSASDLPLVVSFSFDQGTRTMMGAGPADVAAAVEPLGVAALGANCGRSLADMDAIVEELLAAAPGVPLWIKPNAGIPRVVGDEVVYEAGPEELARHLAAYAERGVRVVGGCCGSTPAHVAAIAAALGRRSAS